MTSEEWQRRLPLDAKGFAQLGVALYLGRSTAMRELRRIDLSNPENWWAVDDEDNMFRPGGASYGLWQKGQRWKLKQRLIPTKLAADDKLTARRMTFEDFRYNWYCLRECPHLAITLRDGIPRSVRRDCPRCSVISQEPDHPAFEELEQFWIAEFDRRAALGARVFFDPRTEDEKLSRAANSDICGQPDGRGPPENIGEDVTDEAVWRAIELAELLGVSLLKAVTMALVEFPPVFDRSVRVPENGWRATGNKDAAHKRIYERARKLRRVRKLMA